MAHCPVFTTNNGRLKIHHVDSSHLTLSGVIIAATITVTATPAVLVMCIQNHYIEVAQGAIFMETI